MFATGAIFCPSFETSQIGPTFSVISMRPSGRKAIRQGSSKVLTVVMVKGTLASGFCSPALTWPQAAADARVKSNAAFANFIVIFSCASRAPGPKLRDAGCGVPDPVMRVGHRLAFVNEALKRLFPIVQVVENFLPQNHVPWSAIRKLHSQKCGCLSLQLADIFIQLSSIAKDPFAAANSRWESAGIRAY